MKLDKGLIIIDVETSGSDTRTASIIQLGAVRLTKRGELKEPTFCLNVIPYTLTWEEEAQKIHKLTPADLVKTGFQIKYVLECFEEWIGNPKKYYIAQWSCGFDRDMLLGAYERVGKKYPFSYRAYDIASIVRFNLAVKHMLPSSCGEGNCAMALGIEVKEKELHNALYDAQLAGMMLQKVI